MDADFLTKIVKIVVLTWDLNLHLPDLTHLDKWPLPLKGKVRIVGFESFDLS